MIPVISRASALASVALMIATSFAAAEPKHGIAMYGEPALPPDFVALPFANPDAPKGGKITFGEGGTFDSLNPYIQKGNAPYGIRAHLVESLMGRSWDEPFTLYCLLCQSIETGPNREWVEFKLREEARFSDGSPVTVEDVMWSIETLGTQGHGRYRGAWSKVADMAAVGPRTVRITFSVPDREMPLIMGLRPILKKSQYEGRDFAEAAMELPIGSGPYLLGAHEMGRYATFVKNPDWWGAGLPFNRGQHNIAEIRYDYFTDASILFEAFKGGLTDTFREGSAPLWASNYSFPAVTSGEVVKAEIPHRRPTGMTGLVMNTRRPMFGDWRVRQALIEAFNFELINATLNGGAEPRIPSYFGNSDLAMGAGPAEGRVRELLEPFAADLLPGALDGYAFPVSDGSEANRAGIRRAVGLLEEAGWTVQDGVLRNAAGEPFSFEILLPQGANQAQSAVDIYIEGLRRLGIEARATVADSAQLTQRRDTYDFDMTWYFYALSLSPGNELNLYFGADGVETPGTRNYMGMASPAAQAMIDTLLGAEDRTEFVAAVQALDRVLTSGRYMIPIWYSPVSRLAHRARLKYPQTLPLYGDWTGFLPDVWWVEP